MSLADSLTSATAIFDFKYACLNNFLNTICLIVTKIVMQDLETSLGKKLAPLIFVYKELKA